MFFVAHTSAVDKAISGPLRLAVKTTAQSAQNLPAQVPAIEYPHDSREIAVAIAGGVREGGLCALRAVTSVAGHFGRA
jgi:hypothetical protein